jgi:hypothetical protein
MRRSWTVDAEDQEHVDRSVQFLNEALYFLGGTFSAIAQRRQISDDEFVPERVLFLYESYAPARKAEREPVAEEYADTADLEPVESG